MEEFDRFLNKFDYYGTLNRNKSSMITLYRKSPTSVMVYHLLHEKPHPGSYTIAECLQGEVGSDHTYLFLANPDGSLYACEAVKASSIACTPCRGRGFTRSRTNINGARVNGELMGAGKHISNVAVSSDECPYCAGTGKVNIPVRDVENLREWAMDIAVQNGWSEYYFCNENNRWVKTKVKISDPDEDGSKVDNEVVEKMATAAKTLQKNKKDVKSKTKASKETV